MPRKKLRVCGNSPRIELDDKFRIKISTEFINAIKKDADQSEDVVADLEELDDELEDEDLDIPEEEENYVNSEEPDEQEKYIMKGSEVEKVRSEVYEISIIEFAIYNEFLNKCRYENIDNFKTNSYGKVEEISRIQYGGTFRSYLPWWFLCTYKGMDLIIQTRIFADARGKITCELNITLDEAIDPIEFDKMFKHFNKSAFNNSEYKGKCIQVKVIEGSFQGITIIETDDFECPLVLNKPQERFLTHFERRVLRGSQVRYLLNGEPGTGKTESIRRIIKKITPNATFVIPEFHNTSDLKTVLEACEIFEPGVVVIDDIDLYLGSRDKGTYTSLLGDFLTFFDGVKKRKISLLASTNDKRLVDKAAERPGRFNIILDFSYLEDDQIEDVVNMHFPKKWQIKEIYSALKGKDKDGKDIKVTGAFIANLAENIKEMSQDDKEWSLEDTLLLIEECYAGFYSSQTNKKKDKGIGFKFKTDK